SLKDPKNVGLDYNSDIVLFNTKLEGVEFRALLIRMKNMDDFHRVILKKNNIEMALRRTADFYFLDDMEGSTVAWNEDGILFLDKVNRYNFMELFDSKPSSEESLLYYTNLIMTQEKEKSLLGKKEAEDWLGTKGHIQIMIPK